MTIEEARALLNDVRKKESIARSEFNKYKTEEYNNALKKVKAERRKVVKLCKSVGMNVSPSGVEQPEGAPIWIKKKFRKEAAVAPVPSNEPRLEQDNVILEDEQPKPIDSEETTRYIKMLEYLKSNAVITPESEESASNFIRQDFKSREEKLKKHEETLKQLVDIGALSKEKYESCLEALRKDLFAL